MSLHFFVDRSAKPTEWGGSKPTVLGGSKPTVWRGSKAAFRFQRLRAYGGMADLRRQEVMRAVDAATGVGQFGFGPAGGGRGRPGGLSSEPDEWVSPQEYLDLWRPNWTETFSPLCAAVERWQRLRRHGNGRPRQGYFVRGGLLFKIGFYSDRLCVPCPKARVVILRQLHDSALAGHCGRHKTAARVQERYYWGDMWGDIHHFVLSCVTCKRNRALKRATWRDAQVIGAPDFCWQHLHMDWMVGFPPSSLENGKPHDSMLTFIPRLSGLCRFVSARATDTAEDTAVHLINSVIRHHGCPDRIIADNDTRLRADFWQALTNRLGIDMRHTSTYNPRANGKVEVSHSTHYDILRAMVSRWGDNWAEHLPMAEFAFNRSVCSSTGFSPFEVAYGRRHAFLGDLRDP